MKGYKSFSDSAFLQYVELKNNTYEEEVTITPEKLMELAENTYKARVQKGVWMSPSAEQQEIISLMSQINKITQKKQVDTNKNKTLPVKGKTKEEWLKINLWKYDKPTKEDGTMKEKNGKTYHWCKHHNMWDINTEEKMKRDLTRNIQRIKNNQTTSLLTCI